MRAIFRISTTILMALGAAACGRDGATTASPTPTPAPAPTPTPAASARYLVTFQTSWSRETYAAPDVDAQPSSPIRRLDGFPVAERGAVAPFGTFTFRRLQ